MLRGADRRSEEIGGQRGPDRQSERTRQTVREDQTGGQKGPDRQSEQIGSQRRSRQAVREEQTGGQRGAHRVFSAFHPFIYLI